MSGAESSTRYNLSEVPSRATATDFTLALGQLIHADTQCMQALRELTNGQLASDYDKSLKALSGRVSFLSIACQVDKFIRDNRNVIIGVPVDSNWLFTLANGKTRCFGFAVIYWICTFVKNVAVAVTEKLKLNQSAVKTNIVDCDVNVSVELIHLINSAIGLANYALEQENNSMYYKKTMAHEFETLHRNVLGLRTMCIWMRIGIAYHERIPTAKKWMDALNTTVTCLALISRSTRPDNVITQRIKQDCLKMTYVLRAEWFQCEENQEEKAHALLTCAIEQYGWVPTERHNDIRDVVLASRTHPASTQSTPLGDSSGDDMDPPGTVQESMNRIGKDPLLYPVEYRFELKH